MLTPILDKMAGNLHERVAQLTIPIDKISHSHVQVHLLIKKEKLKNQIPLKIGENIWVQNYLESCDPSYENNRLNSMDSLDNSWVEEYLITSEQGN
ncbi:hypothetical protein NPIL_1031 [Nephila pilipes]|uniref:Uncharacterized protein n=1 Tax=Nephila pilipes TaxID=299642 RepID=A0A8X6TLS8_NEPPI|nr:hypothetical protein NPIL_1031 [Nephila pilipes]